MRWFDSHAHLQDEKYNDDFEAVVRRASQAGVRKILLPGADLISVERAAAIAGANPEMFCFSSGIHPHDASSVTDDVFARTISLAEGEANVRAVAIGEVGLDYHYDFSPRQLQMKVFEQYIELSWQLKIPLIVHSREATEDTLSVLRRMAAKGRLLPVPGVFHCFSGSVETADVLLDMGFYLGFDGPITFRNSRKSSEVIKNCPSDRLLIETDSPYLSPEPLRGKRNEPANLPHIGRKMADIKNVSLEDIAEITWNNAVRLFGLE